MFQDFSSSEINNDFSNYLYTIKKRIKEDKLKTNIYVKENIKLFIKIPKWIKYSLRFQKILEKYNISIEISDNLKNSSDTIFQIDRIIKIEKKKNY